MYKLSVSQCKQYAAISTATNHTVVEFYADCRQVCTSWIWDDKRVPKLGGFGKVVEMDESHFAGAPKFNRGHRLGLGRRRKMRFWSSTKRQPELHSETSAFKQIE